MCGKTKYFGRTYVPGSMMNITISGTDVIAATWGFIPSKGSIQYNTRIEKLSDRGRVLRGALQLEGFFEHDKHAKEWFFSMPDGEPTFVAVTYRETSTGLEFSILTRAAKPPLVGIHSRQPLILGDVNAWLDSGFIKPPIELLTKTAA